MKKFLYGIVWRTCGRDTGPNGPDNWQFTDQAKNHTLNVVGQVLGSNSQNPYRKVIFDGDAAGWVEGGTEGDHLYGGGGDDIVKGNGGDDYLEGQQGADELQGGAGRDISIEFDRIDDDKAELSLAAYSDFSGIASLAENDEKWAVAA